MSLGSYDTKYQHVSGRLFKQGFNYGKGKDSLKQVSARFGGAGTMHKPKKSKHVLNLKSKSAKQRALDSFNSKKEAKERADQ